MRQVLVLGLVLILTARASARAIEFSDIANGSRIRLVLAGGGECAGKAAGWTADGLAVKLSADSPCGTRNTTVLVRQSNLSGIERKEASAGRKVGATTAGLFSGAFVAGLAASAATGRAGIALLLASWVGVAVGVDHLIRRGSGYTLFVARLD